MIRATAQIKAAALSVSATLNMKTDGIFRKLVGIPAGRLKIGYRLLAHVPGQLDGPMESRVMKIRKAWDVGFHPSRSWLQGGILGAVQATLGHWFEFYDAHFRTELLDILARGCSRSL